MEKAKQILPVWFFTGILLLIYGVIVLVAGINQLSHPPHAVLARYHSGIWGGIVLLGLGSFYTLRFWPRKPPPAIQHSEENQVVS